MDTPRTKGKRLLPNVPSYIRCSPRTVCFNTETMETSVGGTNTVGHIRNDPLGVSVHIDRGNKGSVTVLSNVEPSQASDLNGKENIEPNIEERTQHMQLKVKSKVTISTGRDHDAGTEADTCDKKVTITLADDDRMDACDEKVTLSKNDKNAWTVHVPREAMSDHDRCNINPKDSCSTPVQQRRITDVDLTSIGGDYSPGMKSTPVRRYTLETKIIDTPDCYSAVQFDDPRCQLVYDVEGSDEDSSSVTVAVRVRKFLQRELDKGDQCVVSMSDNEVEVKKCGKVQTFVYDYVFNSLDSQHSHYASQEHVYRHLAAPLLGKAFEGYNTCLFAYGQTGSGKSYSIMGHGSEDGIIPRFCKDLFCRADVARNTDKVKINVDISLFEIYNEKIHDLLASKNKGAEKPALKVREHPSLGPYVEGLSTYPTNSFEDVEGWINLGNKNRATAATAMNDQSSRSHAVFTLVLTQTRSEQLEGIEHDHSTTSKINLVDLAGSERQSQAKTSGQRLREGTKINQSLMTLGNVIRSLSDQALNNNRGKKAFIPYRDSVLTQLLKESLGGNSKTAMIATISPSCQHVEETLSTLRYASKARSIVNMARVNEDPKAKMIRELRAEIERLRNQSGFMTDDTHTASMAEIANLKERLLAREKEMEEITRSWQQKLRQAEERKAAESKQLEKAGIAFKVDKNQPNLMNLNEDAQLSEILCYILKEGQTRVGSICASSDHEIPLSGALIADNHCLINNEDNVVTVTPIGDALTYVNGNSVLEPTILHHGDRVILGSAHYFRFNHPKEAKNKAASSSQEMKDFVFARQELIQVQDARLQAEREEMEIARKEVEQVLNTQKTGYEGKLKQLEKVVQDQSEEVQRAQQSHEEAQGLIESLRKQNMVLEQRVVAGRRRQELEAKAAKKVTSQVPSEKSPLIVFLEEEKEKALQRLELVKQKRQETGSLSKRHQTLDAQTGKTDLYRVALLLKEANKISQLLKKNVVFVREDYLDETNHCKTFIKVTDTNLAVCTFWHLAKFEEKLLQMRDLYQNDADSSDDEVFHDPADTWEHDERNSPCKSPRSRFSSHRSSMNQSFTVSTPPHSSPHSPPHSSGSCVTSTGVGEECSQESMDQEVQTCSGVQTADLCIDLVMEHMENWKAFYCEESIGDKLLICCERIGQGVQVVQDYSSHSSRTITDIDQNTSVQKSCVQLVSHLHTLTSLCGMWSSLYATQSSAVSLTDKLRGHVKVTGNQLALLFQGCQNGLDRLVQDAGGKVRECMLEMCLLVGQMSLAMDMTMLSLDRCTEDLEPVLSGQVCQAFLCGCNVLVDKGLQEAIRTMEEYEKQAQAFMESSTTNLSLGEFPQNVEILIRTCKILLSKCQEIQVEVDMLLREDCDMVPGQYYSLGYHRSRGMISQINNLLDTVGLLLQSIAPIMEGKTGDVRKVCRCSELIQKGTAKLMAASGHENSKVFQMSCSSDLTNVSVLSDSQTEQLEFAAQDVNLAAGALIEQVKKLIDLEKLISTPRGKRLLPVSPDKGVNSVLSPLHSLSLRRNISLLASAGHS